MIKNDKHILQIKNIFYDIKSITMPAIQGCNHAVYIVKTNNKKYICRFSSPETAKHNFYVSRLLLANNINVPDVSIHQFQDMYCETYAFLEGKTLHERILEGISDDKKNKIYEQLYDLSCKIASIQYDSKKVNSHENIFAKMTDKLFSLANPHDKKVLVYADLNVKNILLDQDDNVCALIDLDSIDERNFSFGFVSMMSCAKSAGYIPQETIKKYLATRQKTRVNIQKQIHIYNFLVQVYINVFRKHMLNFKGK